MVLSVARSTILSLSRTRSSSQRTAALSGHRIAWVGLGLLGAGFTAFVGQALFAQRPAVTSTDLALYVSLFVGASLMCFGRGLMSEIERPAWLLLSLALMLWAAGEFYLDFELPTNNPPFPSLADAGYLGFYLPLVIALFLLGRARLPRFSASSWLNGVIGALGAMTLTAALIYNPLVRSMSGPPAAIATTLAYPMADLAVFSVLAMLIGLAGWRIGKAFSLIAAALMSFWLSDMAYFLGNAHGTWVSGRWTCLGWPLAAMLLALAAWQRPQPPVAVEERRKVTVFIPLVATALVAGVLLFGDFLNINMLAESLAGATLICLLVRMWQVFSEAHNAAERMETASHTDALTGLANRRRLQLDLGAIVDGLTTGRPGAAFVIFDLNGFKDYNDTFGHPAGDDLLRCLGQQLQAVVEGVGKAYRLGGDEFCVVLPLDDQLSSRVNAAVAALSSSGERFSIDAAYGMAEIPAEAESVVEAMKFADHRMYAQKAGGRASVGTQMRDVLLRALTERDGDLSEHNDNVANLVKQVAIDMSLTQEQIDEAIRAAELHDVGKVAVPDKILFKPGSLTDEEWETMRLHTIVGEKILAASPALVPVARLVRSSHERWDGQGYPDQLREEEIPLGSRIVAVCDAYDAMVSDRPYRKGRPAEAALAELRACAGQQFDPAVVASFLRMMQAQNQGSPLS
jgi:two-component system cell cycle response regulator